jgi:hypothetical protein
VFCPGNQPPPAAEYLAISEHLARNRLSFENHASASETQVAILDARERANEVYPIADLHWSIAHPGEDNVGPTSETLARAARLGIGMTPSDTGPLDAERVRRSGGSSRAARVCVWAATR